MSKIFNIAFLAALPFYTWNQWFLLGTFDKIATPPSPIWKFLISLFCISFMSLFAGVAWWIATKAPKNRRWLAFPAAFTTAEWVKSSIYPWGLVGGIWGDSLPVLQTASIIGIHGLSFLTILLASSLITKHFRTAAAIVFGVFLIGEARLRNPETYDNFRVRLVSPIDRKEPSALAENIKTSTKRSAADLDLIVWGENHIGDDQSGLSTQELVLLRSINSPRSILSAAFSRQDESGKTFSSVGYINQDKMKVYDKMKLAVFGEYIPKWLPITVFSYMDKEKMLTPGVFRPTIRHNGKAIFPYICYETTFHGHQVPSEIDLLVNNSSDSWYPPAGKRHHFEQVRIAAIEEGVPIARSTNHGISAVISPYGRVLATIGDEGFVDSAVPNRIHRTLFSYTGNSLILTICLVILLWSITNWTFPRKRKPTNS